MKFYFLFLRLVILENMPFGYISEVQEDGRPEAIHSLNIISNDL